MKKECKLLLEYLKDNLPEREKSAFEYHLKNCDKCKQEVEQFKEIENALNSMPKLNVPETFSFEVIASIKERKRKVLGWFYYSAVSLSVLLLSFFFVGAIGVKRVFANARAFAHTVEVFFSSVTTAVATISSSLYNTFYIGRFTSVILVLLFAVLSYGFFKSVKVFSKAGK